jgi:hypothetical protein
VRREREWTGNNLERDGVMKGFGGGRERIGKRKGGTTDEGEVLAGNPRGGNRPAPKAHA